VAIVDNAVHARAVDVESHCDAKIVYSKELRFSYVGARPGDGREVAVDIHETVHDTCCFVRIEAGDLAGVVDRRRDRADRVRIVDVSGEFPGVDVVSVAVAIACGVVVESDRDIEVVDPPTVGFRSGGRRLAPLG
jgi:hypothetical protein